MTRLSWLLLAAVFASSLALVHTSHEARGLFHALDRARAEGQALETEHQRLLAERQALGTNLRIERLARDKLQMRHANAAVTHFLGGGTARPGAPR